MLHNQLHIIAHVCELLQGVGLALSCAPSCTWRRAHATHAALMPLVFLRDLPGLRLWLLSCLQYEGEGAGSDADEACSKTIDFVYDPEVDTPDEIAAEISSEFHLSSTDRDICAAALKEWLAREMDERAAAAPDPQGGR